MWERRWRSPLELRTACARNVCDLKIELISNPCGHGRSQPLSRIIIIMGNYNMRVVRR